ncbi:MAG: M81 family metallopeptidase [Granulosicoccaceae bacterium]
MARIAVAGFQHETNTFAPLKADLAAFELRNDWPPLCHGESMLAEVEVVHLPIQGAIEHLRSQGHELVPLLWGSAMPSDRVTREAFEVITGRLIDMLTNQWPVDGLYLDLHGAMVCEHFEDGEGEILRRLREHLGEQLPIAVSLDLHANITEQMVKHASVIDCFREYPHNDMGVCGARTAASLLRLIARGQARPAHSVLHKLSYQIPLTQGCTYIEPAKGVYQLLEQLAANPALESVVFACGFPLADTFETGPAILVSGNDESAVQSAADTLLKELQNREADFALAILSPIQAAHRAIELNQASGKPVVIADTQDNPGGGGAGDTVGMLRALLDAEVQSAVFGLVIDKPAAAAAHRAGVGSTLDLSLGEWSGFTGNSPFEGTFKVVALGDGNCTGTGPMWLGAHMAMGPCALLQIEGVRVMVASENMQLADQAMLRHLNIEPVEEQILVLKSSVHFRNDFQAIAAEVLVAASPGPVHADLSRLDYRKIRPGIRIAPRTA